MIDHISIPVCDLAVAARFYDDVLAPLGLRRLAEREHTIGFGSKYPEFWLNQRTRHGAVADSGHHVGLRASSEVAVREFFERALKLGATGAGDPGPRQAMLTTCYAAFILDRDGHKIEAVTFPRP